MKKFLAVLFALLTILSVFSVVASAYAPAKAVAAATDDAVEGEEEEEEEDRISYFEFLGDDPLSAIRMFAALPALSFLQGLLILVFALMDMIPSLKELIGGLIG